MTFPYNPDALKETLASPEEIRRATVAHNAGQRLVDFIRDLEHLNEKDLRKKDVLSALEMTGEKILELALHTRGRLRAAEGRTDPYLEATAANVIVGLRKAAKTMELHDQDLGVWVETFELTKPIQKDLQRTSEGLERPGIKMAVMPPVPEKPKPEPGPRLIEENGEPAPAAEQAPEPPAPAPLQTLGYSPVEDGGVIDVEVEVHPLDGSEDPEGEVQELMNKLEEAGVQEAGLTRKDWAKALKAWNAIWPEGCEIEVTKKVYDLLTVALARNPITWDIPGEKEVFDYERKLAIAAGE